MRWPKAKGCPRQDTFPYNATGMIFFHAILVIKRDKSLNKLIKGLDVPTEQTILQQSTRREFYGNFYHT